jgi:Ni/Co efflux regulator RcnB
MKTLLSTIAALAVMTVAGAALAQDAPADDSSAPPAKHHHHAKKQKATDASATSDDSAAMKGRTEHGGAPSSPKEKAETEKLNEQQLAGTH